MNQKILNKRSSAVVDGQPKLPNPSQLEYGEIAINFSKGHETFSILNTERGITTFSCDEIRDAKLSAHTGNVSMHLPQVTASDNGKMLQVSNGAFNLMTPGTIYAGDGTPSSGTGNNGDIYLKFGPQYEVVYNNSTSGVLATENYSITFNEALDDFDYVLCYFRPTPKNLSNSNIIPQVILRIDLNSEAALSSGEYTGAKLTPYIDNDNRLTSYACVINSQKTQFRVAYQVSLYGTVSTNISNASHGIYCYKIVGVKNDDLNI